MEKLYKKLKLDVVLPSEIEEDIEDFLNYLNNGGDPDLSDVYRSTIRNDINCYEYYDFDEDVGSKLRDYYVYGGIFNNDGN